MGSIYIRVPDAWKPSMSWQSSKPDLWPKLLPHVKPNGIKWGSCNACLELRSIQNDGPHTKLTGLKAMILGTLKAPVGLNSCLYHLEVYTS